MSRAVAVSCAILTFLVLLTGCDGGKETIFLELDSERSGVYFVNQLTETAEVNIFNYLYFYNGGGVAVGDVNGDSLPDIYFTGNQVSNKLFVNLGNLHFKDITNESLVAGPDGWCTGVTMADVNGDGRLDIYVSYLGDYLIYKGRNQLFINEGNDDRGMPHFREAAEEFGLALTGFSTQASFFDCDNDGDLDMYMLNHSVHQNGTFGRSEMRMETHPKAGDKLLRNDKGKFVDATSDAGIFSSALGYGLGVVVSDVNLDGWLDIYVGNDFHENDYLYINQCNGTFREVSEEYFGHTSRYTMGVDFADINNDLLPDLFSADMLPYDQFILKKSMGEDSYDVYQFKAGFGYSYQYARNNLQLNNGDGTFSEIGLVTNTYATDWSWSTLLSDFDLDGNKDIVIANGIFRRSNDLDYINFITIDSVQKKIAGKIEKGALAYIEKMPQIKVSNSLFLNRGNLQFERAAHSGFKTTSYSNGMAYGDLDNDGDLDLVVNNLNQESIIYENQTINNLTERVPFLTIRLIGKGDNTSAIGAKVVLFSQSGVQAQEVMPTRGYQSSVDPKIIFGVKEPKLDSIWIIWPDKTFSRLSQVAIGQHLVLDQTKLNVEPFEYDFFHKADSPKLISVSAKGLDFSHQENEFLEFNREYLLPHMISAQGPGVAVGDFSGDGLDDVFLGGAKWQKSCLYTQLIDGTFIRSQQPYIEMDSVFEDVRAEFADTDGDGDLDLIVVSGGNEFWGSSIYQSPRLYINDGEGLLVRCATFPQLKGTFSCVASHDIDGDGDIDLFFGARAVPWKYGELPESKILVNKGGNVFEADRNLLENERLGMITDAKWTDIDNDGLLELILSREWDHILVMSLDGSNLTIRDVKGLDVTGLWQSLLVEDIDGDGDDDIVAGNLGLNSKWKASQREPLTMYVGDFDENDSIDQVITHWIDGREVVFATRDELTKQMPSLKKRFLSYAVFAEASFTNIFSRKAISRASKFQVRSLATTIFINDGIEFKVLEVPGSSQFSPVRAILSTSFNRNQKKELLLAGNLFRVNTQLGRYDASYGTTLYLDSEKRWMEMSRPMSGFMTKGEIVSLKDIVISGKSYILTVKNDDHVQLFEIR
jgi:hypothetical protein